MLPQTTAPRADNDFYSTPPEMIDYLLSEEDFDEYIWEPCCGNGSLVNKLREHGHQVAASDLVDRGCPDSYTGDFLTHTEPFDGDIITNPPYRNSLKFVKKALDLSKRKVAMFLNLHFIEGAKRYTELNRETKPKTIYVLAKRVTCYKNGDINCPKSSGVCYAWFVWDKQYTGETTIKIINNV